MAPALTWQSKLSVSLQWGACHRALTSCGDLTLGKAYRAGVAAKWRSAGPALLNTLLLFSRLPPSDPIPSFCFLCPFCTVGCLGESKPNIAQLFQYRAIWSCQGLPAVEQSPVESLRYWGNQEKSVRENLCLNCLAACSLPHQGPGCLGKEKRWPARTNYSTTAPSL